MGARIALISASADRKNARSLWPHYGLVLLATVLRRAGYEAMVFDQSYLRCTPEEMVEHVRAFAPAVVGASLYTTHVERGSRLTQGLIRALPGVPVIAGGPHVSLYADSMRDSPFAALVCGEAEGTIVDVVRRVLEGQRPGKVVSGVTPGESIAEADFQWALGSADMAWLPIQLSRGCPFNCSFCEVKHVASRQIRYRGLARCLDEIEQGLKKRPKVHTVRIVDDCPTLNVARFKEFLRTYRARGIRACISIDNMRADTIDEELLVLMKECRTPHICLAVESGNPEVFRLIDKGETLEDIRRAAGLVRRQGIPLQLCFVVGLPGSTFEAEMDSLRLAKSLKPQIIHWNMFLPHRGTRAREWFVEHGTVFDELNCFSLQDYDLRFTLPAVESPEFTRRERLRAWTRCVLETASFLMTPLTIARALRTAVRLNLWSSIPRMFTALPGRFLMFSRLAIQRMKLSRGG